MTTHDVTATPTFGARPGLAVTERRVIRSEWIKLATVRSTVIGLGCAALTLIILGALFSGFTEGGGGDGGGPGSGGSLTTSLNGMLLAQLLLGMLGVLFASSEYTSGMIRASLAAVRSRGSVLRGKTVVVAGTIFVVMLIAAFIAFVIGNAIYAGNEATYSITDSVVLRAIFGAALYGAGIGALGVALGFLLRSTAGAIGVLVALLLVAPLMLQLVPGSVGDWITKVLPSNAGQQIMQATPESGQFSAWTGLAVFGAWIVAAFVAALIALRRRDA